MKKKFLSLFSSEVNFILICSFLISGLSLIPLIAPQWYAPKNTFFSFAHNYVPDYYQYISWMKDGADGKLLITSRYSPEKFPRQPVYLFYPFFGFIFSKIGLDLFVSYTLLRIILGLVNIFLIYLFIRQIFPQTLFRKTAFFLALFLPPFYRLKPFSLILPFVTSIDPLQRIFFLPHDLATMICILAGILLLNRFLKEKVFNRYSLFTNRYLLLAICCFFLASIFNPALLTIFYLFLAPALFLTILIRQFTPKQLILAGILVFAAGAPAILYYRHLFSTALPFSWLYSQQKTVSFNIKYSQFLLSAGPTFFLALFSMPDFLRKKDFLSKAILTWAFFPFLAFPFVGKTIPFSIERLFEVNYFIPLAILAANSLGKITRRVNIVLFTLLLFCLPYFYLSLKTQLGFFWYPYINIYVSRPLIQAFSWLDKNTPDESNVIAGYYTSNMLPAFTHNRVLFGHDFVTYKAAEKRQQLFAVFGKETPPAEFENILDRYQIKYIFLSPETPKFTETNLPKLNSLKLVFFNQENSVYEYK